MIGVTIIIGITISLYGNYISIIIMPTLIADSISPKSIFYNSPHRSSHVTSLLLRFRYSGIASFRVQGEE